MMPGWLLPAKPRNLRIANVRDHIVMFDRRFTGKEKKVIYKGRSYKSKMALANTYKVSRKVVDRWVNEGKVKTL